MREIFIGLLCAMFGVVLWPNGIGFFGGRIDMTLTHFHRWRDRFNYSLTVGGCVIISVGVPVIVLKMFLQ